MVKSKKVNHFFDILNDIKRYKTGKYLKSEEHMKKFNTFLILRTLSKDDSIVNYVDLVSLNQDRYNSEQMYKMLLKLIPKSFKYPKINKKSIKENDILKEYSQCFEISSADVYLIKKNHGIKYLEQRLISLKGYSKKNDRN